MQKRKCGLIKPKAFKCDAKGWNCKKCMDFTWYLMGDINTDLRKAHAKLAELPNAIKGLKETYDVFMDEYEVIKKYVNAQILQDKKIRQKTA